MLIDLTRLPVIVREDCPEHVVVRTTRYEHGVANHVMADRPFKRFLGPDASIFMKNGHLVCEYLLSTMTGQRQSFYGWIKSLTADGAIKSWMFKITTKQAGVPYQILWTIHDDEIPLLSVETDLSRQHPSVVLPLARYKESLREPKTTPNIFDFIV
jgi:hypothetical protein